MKAQDVLEKATQLDPESARTFTALGMAFIDQGKFEQAIPPLERSLKINPASSETHCTLAKAYYSHEQYDAALKESQQALAESHRASPEIELLVAQSLAAVGRYEDAAQTLRDYLKNHPKDPGRPRRGSDWTVWRQMERSGATRVVGAQRSASVCQWVPIFHSSSYILFEIFRQEIKK